MNFVLHPDAESKSLVHRFPDGVLYSIEPDRIFILSAMHLRREPEYWKQR